MMVWHISEELISSHLEWIRRHDDNVGEKFCYIDTILCAFLHTIPRREMDKLCRLWRTNGDFFLSAEPHSLCIKPKTGRIFLKRFLGGGWRELVCGWMDREWTVIFVLLLFTFFNISAEKSSLDPRTTVTFWDGQMIMMTRSCWSDTIERAVA